MSENHEKDHHLKRDPAIELARVIGCLIVIGCHTYLPTMIDDHYDSGRLFFGLLFADGVALFWLICGAFLFNNNDYGRLLKKSAEKILLPMILVGFIYLFFDFVKAGTLTFREMIIDNKERYLDIILGFLRWRNGFPSFAHSWYVYIYMLLMISFPALKGVVTFTDQVRHRRYVLIGGILIFLGLNDIAHNQIALFSHYMFNGLCAAALFTIIGYYLYQARARFQKKRYIVIASVVFIAGLLIREVIQLHRGINDIFIMYWYSFFGAIAASCVLIFCIALIPNNNNSVFNRSICYLASYTFPIYLIHVLFLNIIDSTGLSEDLEKMIMSWNSGMIGEAVYMIAIISMVFWSSFIAVFIFRTILSISLKCVNSSTEKDKGEQIDQPEENISR